MPMLGRAEKVALVASHDGEPAGALADELLVAVRELDLDAWWEKDRKWVSLAQRVGVARITSTDRGFRRVKKILKKHEIAVVYIAPT